jgi:hypothetical protein
VHSFVGLNPDGSTDIDGVLDSSFGEYAGDVSVAYNAVFIQSLISPSPEPITMLLVGIALVAISLMGARRRHR